MTKRRSFGSIRKLPSKRSPGLFQARYVGPDTVRYNGPHRFETKEDAAAWLYAERRLILSGEWKPPSERKADTDTSPTLNTYAPGVIDRRRNKGEPLRPRTKELYRSILDRVILPDLGHLTLKQLTPERVIVWYDSLDPNTPTARAHAYSLLRTIMGQAVEEKLISSNPCTIKGAGRTYRKRAITIPTRAEVETIADNMPEHLRGFILLAAWCALRFGEAAELRRKDLHINRMELNIARAMTHRAGQTHIGPPKTDAGARTVKIPPHLKDTLTEHLAAYVGRGRESLLFPRRPGDDQHLIHTEVTKQFAKARSVAGRSDLRLHDLRHAGATWAARTGATTAELMARIGHSSPEAALRYQHAARERDAEIAEKLSRMAE